MVCEHSNIWRSKRGWGGGGHVKIKPKGGGGTEEPIVWFYSKDLIISEKSREIMGSVHWGQNLLLV